ncbi:phosphoribosylformimino-5-aminoimidazole carboxamide ribotide isomerase [Mariniblastus sp.]|jgi:phosphoribosylformimino-5-aminoimidazole carboxamide ribotide isomerase|nr:phosphoribosylformimino-5-aminoimidazole carboxamide ribotide isomerase [bacterium]MDB4564304.1 phosphoribosylformimino-5-aminoimidazole carboxamide ribotide isomerase [Mariniblastus sp.]MDC3224403.1 phosphoribosylformimino-5-aminoimidazole carboxamide ribotide isomerase [Mariniblastus sp.]
MTIFRPCIDLHDGQVKQIVGSTLFDPSNRSSVADDLVVNFVSERTAAWFAEKYKSDNLQGGHLIQLGPGNEAAALGALAAFPGGLQLGGGISLHNAARWLDRGASHVIVTSCLFDDAGRFLEQNLIELEREIGASRLVIDLSCKRTTQGWMVAKDRWQTLTDLPVNHETLERLANYCDEFLIHAADVEGLCQGVDAELIGLLGAWGGIPMTYAGGVASMDDIRLVSAVGEGKVDVTVGSSLDVFGGSGVAYRDLLDWNQSRRLS